MTIHQVAAQLYTVRDYTKTLPEFVVTLQKLRAIGYEAVQISAIGPIPDEEVARAARDAGLTICATHEASQTILDEPHKVVERLEAYSCRYTAYPYPGGVPLETLDDVRSFAARLDAAGQVLAEAGKVLTYHNHNIEFRRFDGRLMLEVLYDETDPRHLQGEPDTYWVQYGGGDPVDWCRRLAGRLPLLHLKDYITRPDNKPDFAEIGYGNLDWKRIIAAADEAGCEWFIVEQDTCPGDPFDSLKMSFDYIRDNLCA
jgi:sugar phosphate isomerase/epimerase